MSTNDKAAGGGLPPTAHIETPTISFDTANCGLVPGQVKLDAANEPWDEPGDAEVHGQFKAAMLDAGLEPPDIIEADGKLHRFATNGKHDDNSGWYVLHGDGIPAGSFGDWRSGLKHNWRVDIGKELTPDEEAAYQAKVEAMRLKREAEEVKLKAEAMKKATAIWQASAKAADNHPYLAHKGVKGHGLKQNLGGILIVPMRDGDEMHSLQFIGVNGAKWHLTGGRVQGCYFSIGTMQGATALCLCEGFATGASIHEATEHPVVVAFSAGNLLAVAKTMRATFPNLRLIVCADDDTGTEGNPGLTKATEAARAVGGCLAIPDFGEDRPEKATDFNDLARHRGPEAVREAVAKAKPSTSGNGNALECICLADIEAKPVNWLWPDRIALGALTLVSGMPNKGKSTLSLGLGAIVSRGGTWPVSRDRCEPGGVLLLSAEDAADYTIRPRVEAAKGDVNNFHVLGSVGEVDKKGNTFRRVFNLKLDIERLERKLKEIGNVKLVIIDPLSSYLGKTDSHNNAEVRGTLAPLADFAERNKVAVIGVDHLNKGGKLEAMLNFMGSIAFIGAARAAYLVAEDKANPSRLFFATVKNNLGPKKGAYTFTIEAVLLPGGIESSCTAWGGEVLNITANEVIAPDKDKGDRGALKYAQEFLQSALSDGPVPAKKIKSDARDAEIKSQTLRRAREDLGIIAGKEPGGNFSVWRLPAEIPF